MAFNNYEAVNAKRTDVPDQLDSLGQVSLDAPLHERGTLAVAGIQTGTSRSGTFPRIATRPRCSARTSSKP